MNERIQQLKEQATVDVKDDFGHWINSELDKVKFAELIVQECMSNLYLNGYDDAMIQIQEHFGVEE